MKASYESAEQTFTNIARDIMRVTVLMSSYNGEKYINEQIESVLSQEKVDVDLLIRDDGSTDSTVDILRNYEHDRVSFYEGKNIGAAKSFFELIYDCKPDSDFYALCDQDDFWLPCKLSKAIQFLKKECASNIPSLYCSDVKLVDQNLKSIARKNIFYPLKTVEQSIVSCGGAGCTMVFNKELLLALHRFPRDEINNIRLMHDNWIYKVNLSIGGHVAIDYNSYILYRQHESNTIGALQKNGLLKRHLRAIAKNRNYRSESLKTLFNIYGEYMPETNYRIYNSFVNYKKGLKRIGISLNPAYKTGNRRNDLLFKISILLGLF